MFCLPWPMTASLPSATPWDILHPDQQQGNKDWDGGIDKGQSINCTNNSSPSLVPLLLIPRTLSCFLSTPRCHQFTMCQCHLQLSLSCCGCIYNGLVGLPCHLFLLHFDPQDCRGHCFWRRKGQGPQRICCILVFYVTVVGLTFIHRFVRHAPHVVHIMMSHIYFLFPPFMNPVTYSIKTKQIQTGIIHFFFLFHSRA